MDNDIALHDGEDEITKYLDEYGAALEKEKNTAVTWRQTYEQRWLDAERQHRDGISILSGVKYQGGSADLSSQPVHQRARDNITKTLTRKVSARIKNMLFGTDEQQFDIEPSPKATLSAFATSIDISQPNAAELIAQNADRSAAAMEKTIKDYLAEADYATHGRRAIDDGVLVGTGVIHGPFPKLVNRKVSNTSKDEMGNATQTYIYETKIVPSVERLDYRRFYPKPCRNMRECEGVFILDLMTPKQLMALRGNPESGFSDVQLARLLEKEPDPGLLAGGMGVSQSGGLDLALKGKYPVWKYTGQISKRCIESLGGEGAGKNETIDGEVWFSQGVTLKAVPKDDEALPFHVFNYTIDPDSVFGFGVPHDIAADQDDINVSWSAMKLNAMAAAYPIVGLLKGAFETENGVIEFPIKKPLTLTGDDIRTAIQISTIPSTIGDIAKIYDQSKANAEEHVMIQSMEESAPSNVQLGAAMFAMLKVEDNIIQSDAAKSWDDNITKPNITAFIDYELLNGDDMACKGVFDVIPKATSHLLTKDIVAQQAMQALVLAGNPANAMYYKTYELNRQVMQQTMLKVDEVMVTKEEADQIAQQQAQKPNPMAEQIKLEQYKIDKTLEIATLKANNDMQIASIRARSEQLASQMMLEAASIKAASDENMNAQELDSRQRIAALTAESKAFGETLKDSREREKAASKTQMEAAKIEQADAKVQVQLENEAPFRI